MLTQTGYIGFLLNTPRDCTGMHVAAHLPEVSHDQVDRGLRNSAFPSRPRSRVAYSIPTPGRCLLHRADIYGEETIRQVALEID